MPINNITQTISTLPPAGSRGVDVQTQFVIKQEDFQDHLQGTTVTELNALKDQLNSRIGEINSTTTTMNGYASTASAGASTATTKAGEASTSASAALTSKNQAGTFATNSSNSATKASQWADNNYNVAVETGRYSAKHWSTVAQNATDGKVDKVTSSNNAIVRFDGVTGAVQNSSVFINDIDVYDTSTGGLAISARAGGKNSIYSYLDTSTLEFYSGITQKTGITINGQTSVGGSKITFRAGGKESGAIDSSGNLLLTSGTGGIGYGVGAGGSVTQLTSKGTSITLNKPSGRITMNNAALAAGATVVFVLSNSLITNTDMVYCQALTSSSIYRVEVYSVSIGVCSIAVTNESTMSQSDAIGLVFCIIKGAVS